MHRPSWPVDINLFAMGHILPIDPARVRPTRTNQRFKRYVPQKTVSTLSMTSQPCLIKPLGFAIYTRNVATRSLWQVQRLPCYEPMVFCLLRFNYLAGRGGTAPLLCTSVSNIDLDNL